METENGKLYEMASNEKEKTLTDQEKGGIDCLAWQVNKEKIYSTLYCRERLL